MYERLDRIVSSRFGLPGAIVATSLIFATMLGLALYRMTSWNLEKARFLASMKSWEPTKCRILSSEWKDLGYNNHGATRTWEVSYGYLVNRESFTGRNVSYSMHRLPAGLLGAWSAPYSHQAKGDERFLSLATTEYRVDDEPELRRKYFVGAEVDCFVDPRAPGVSALIRSERGDEELRREEANFSVQLFFIAGTSILSGFALSMMLLRSFQRMPQRASTLPGSPPRTSA